MTYNSFQQCQIKDVLITGSSDYQKLEHLFFITGKCLISLFVFIQAISFVSKKQVQSKLLYNIVIHVVKFKYTFYKKTPTQFG